MGYRVRVSDEIYRLLHSKACESGLSVENLTERCILDGLRRELASQDRSILKFSTSPQGVKAPTLRMMQL